MIHLLIAIHVCIFNPACETRINVPELRAAIQAQAPGADIERTDCINWSDGTQRPLEIKVTGVPDNVTCQQVQNFLIAHNPSESDEEEAVRRRLEYRDSQLNKLPTIIDILSRLDALEAP